MILIFSTLTINARILTGNVADESQTPVCYANIAILDNDSTFLLGFMCDSIGNFNHDIPENSALIKVASAGYSNHVQAIPQDYNILNITLKQYAVSLQELVVSSERIVREKSGVMIFPTKRDKEYAHDGVSILQNMGITELNIDPISNNVSTISGQGVSMFIDGIPATKADIQNIPPENIRKIELLYSPKDPKFNGARVALNYIMVKYETGGYTKLNATQCFIYNSGDYSVYSKLTHKAMTFDVMASMGYFNSKHDGYQAISKYIFDKDEIVRDTKTTSQYTKTLTPNVSFRAQYAGKNTTISNLIGVSVDKAPDTWQKGDVKFNSSLYTPAEFESNNSSDSKGVEWTGQYNFDLQKGYALSISPYLNYYYIKELSNYQYGNAPTIINDIKEKALQSRLDINLSKQLGNQSIGGFIRGGYNNNNVKYAGSTLSGINQEEWWGGIGVNTNLQFGNLYWYMNLWASYSNIRINEERYRNVFPHLFTFANYALNQKSSLQFSAEYSIYCGNASMKSPIIIRNNEIDAVRGNPDLKNYGFFSTSLSYYWNPFSNLGLSAYAGVEYRHNPTVAIWEPGQTDGQSYMIKTYINDGDFTNFSLGVSASLRLFNNKLMLQASPSYQYYNLSGKAGHNLNNFSINAYALLYLNRIQLSAYYKMGSSRMSIYNTSHIPQYYYIAAAWSHKNLYIKLSANNIFSKGYKGSEVMQFGEYYNSTRTNFSTSYHPSLTLTVSYFFSYGKKVNRNDEVQSIAGANSAILQ